MNYKLLKKIKKLLASNQLTQVKYLLLKNDFHLIADCINTIDEKKREVFSILPPEIQSEVVLRLNKTTKEIVIPKLSIYDMARFLHFNDEDDATDLMQYLPEQKQHKVLGRIKEAQRRKIEKLLKFGRDTAGGLMDLDYIIIKDTYSFQDVAEKIQEHVEKEKKVPFVIVTKADGRVIGFIPHKKLILSPPNTQISTLVSRLTLVKHTVDQEKIVNKVQNMRGEAIGVVDENEAILGIIHLRDLLKIAQTEATEDIYSFVGLKGEEVPGDRINIKVKRRYLWLIINLGTAFLASAVVGMFQDTISKMALLAVYMPIVAGEGGNAATQALTVVVRGLAVNEIPWSQAKGIIFKESMAGLLNGVIVGVIAGFTAYFFHAPPMLGVVLGIAMVANLFVAGLFGAMVPFVLKSIKVDPAVSSSIFVTTATDVIGFFVFLGLGTMLLVR